MARGGSGCSIGLWHLAQRGECGEARCCGVVVWDHVDDADAWDQPIRDGSQWIAHIAQRGNHRVAIRGRDGQRETVAHEGFLNLFCDQGVEVVQDTRVGVDDIGGLEIEVGRRNGHGEFPWGGLYR